MTEPRESKEERAARIALWNTRELCAECGRLRANVRHEPDPAGAPEGLEYFALIRDLMHAFVPSGSYDGSAHD